VSPADEWAEGNRQDREERALDAEQARTAGRALPFAACSCTDGKHAPRDVIEWVATQYAAYTDTRQAENSGTPAHVITDTTTRTTYQRTAS